ALARAADGVLSAEEQEAILWQRPPRSGLRVAAPPTRSIRTDGALRVRHAPDLASATVAAVHAALEHEGSIAVIATDTLLARLSVALHAARHRVRRNWRRRWRRWRRWPTRSTGMTVRWILTD